MSTAYLEPAEPARSISALARVRRLMPLFASVLVALAAAPIGLALTEHFDRLSESAALGYPALFLAQTLTSATLFLPAPGAALAMAAGTIWQPVWVGVVAGLGSATGELAGYGLGYFGRRAVPVDASRWWRLAETGFRRWGFAALIGLALIPNPFFDALGILAGGLRYPLIRFWTATAIGKVFKFACLAYAAELAATWLRVGL